MKFTVESEQEEDGRWLAEVLELPGVLLEPIVSLVSYNSLSSKDLRQIEEIVREHEDDFKSAWNKHFAQ
jgi:uncharacterized protein DUF4160